MLFRKSFFGKNKLSDSSQVYPYGGVDLRGMDAIVVAPHPDDESIGCGGSIVRHLTAGSRVMVIFLTDGQKGDFEDRFGGEYLKIRRESTLRALDVLGVKDYEFWGYPDSELERFGNVVFDRLKETIGRFKPDILYAPSPFEPHPDHRTAALVGWRLWKKMKQRVAFYEALAPLFPNMINDITDVAETKSRAIGCYHTELVYSDYVSRTAGLNKYRTSTLSRESLFAEAFMLLDEDHQKKYQLPFALLKTALKCL